MKKLLIFVMLFVCSLTVQAQTFFTVGNVRYLLEDGHAVVARQDKELTGVINIPAKVTYGETEYDVTRLMSPDESASGDGGAFQECEITGITLPEAITEIPDYTFYGCRQLSSVELQGPVTRIGGYAFVSCEALTTIDLPNDVTEIGECAFFMSGLTEFKFPAGVTYLNGGAIAGTKIKELEIPATVTKLDGEYGGLTDGQGHQLSITVTMCHRDCREIDCGVGFFGDMTYVDLQVPAGGKEVYQEYLPWMYMKSITEYGEYTGEPLVPDQRHVTIGGIRYLLKNGETNEAYVDIQPESLSGEVVIPDKVTYKDTEYTVTTIMGEIWNQPGGFHICGAFTKTQVTKVTLPASITNINNFAFQETQNLQEVVLNEGITEFGTAAFRDCPELTTINIPSTLITLGGGMFQGCSKLKTLILPEGFVSLQPESLRDSGIETLTIPSTCTSIDNASLYLDNLKTLYVNVKEPSDLKADVTAFGTGWDDIEGGREILEKVDLIVPLGCADSYKVQAPWFYCHSITEEGSEYYQPKKFGVTIGGINYILEETVVEEETVRTATIARQYPSLSGNIDIPEKVSYAKKVLQDEEWVTLASEDYNITGMVLPSQYYGIGNDDFIAIDGAFQDCAITSISLPTTITNIPNGAFFGCQHLKNVTLPEGITVIGAGAFYGCSSLEEIYLPETITDMSERCIFRSCTNLKKVNIPKLVTTLGNGCFMLTGMETFIIPKSVTNIGESCFLASEGTTLKSIKICHDLESYVEGSLSFPEDMFHVFSNIGNITLIVPEDMKDALYSQVYPWKDFGNIIEYTDQGDEHQYNAYSVSYEEEVIGHEQEASDDTTILDYIPSGVDPALPEDTEKEDYVLIDWHDKLGNAPQAVMPAQDILLRLTLALLGDANRDGDVDVSDFLSVANHILGRSPVGFLHKAANTSKGDNEIDVADFLGVANVILRGVHYSNPHHAQARRTASNTDISTMDNAIYVEPASVCVGLNQTLSVKMKNANPVAGFEFSLQLPEGFTVNSVGGASLSNERTTSEKTSSFSYAVLDDGTVKVLCGTMTQNPETGKLYTFDGNDGEVATITVSVDPSMVLGNYSAIVTNAKLADADAVKTTISSNVESVITVSDVLVLDENSTVTPPAASNVTVTVRRTINANEWSTICLPFDMTEEQVKTAFGNDVQLAEFVSYDAVKDGNNVTSITINFDDTDLSEGFYGNYPYIIKTSRDITEFTLTADIAPDVAVAEYDNGKKGGKREVYGSFIGTYKAKTVVPDNSLFLSANKFWYSAGLTKMKAFRAYFTLNDVLSQINTANARAFISIGNKTTGIHSLQLTGSVDDWYTISGMKLDKKPTSKGVYIIDGKKKIIK